MEPLFIDFSDSDTLSGKLKFMGVTTSLVGLIGVIFCISGNAYGYFFYTFLFLFLYGLLMLTPYPYRISTKNKPFIKIDDINIEYRTTPFSSPRKEEWKNISSIIFKPRSIFLETTDNKKKKINLSWISTRNILVIEQSMKDYAASKGLEIFLFRA